MSEPVRAPLPPPNSSEPPRFTEQAHNSKHGRQAKTRECSIEVTIP